MTKTLMEATAQICTPLNNWKKVALVTAVNKTTKDYFCEPLKKWNNSNVLKSTKKYIKNKVSSSKTNPIKTIR